MAPITREIAEQTQNGLNRVMDLINVLRKEIKALPEEATDYIGYSMMLIDCDLEHAYQKSMDNQDYIWDQYWEQKQEAEQEGEDE